MNEQIKEAVLKQASIKNKDYSWMNTTISSMDNLTLWGKIKLCIFTEGIVEKSLSSVYPKNHYKALMNRCLELEPKPDWKWMYDMGRKLGFTSASSSTLNDSNFLTKKTVQQPYTASNRWHYYREKRHGISEITNLAASIKELNSPIIDIFGGKESIFYLWQRMSYTWDLELNKDEQEYELRAYESWKLSEYGLAFKQFFGKHLPFWIS